MTKPAVDLLVTNYNTLDKLQRFLDNLVPSDLWTLSVSDNGSTDGSSEWLSKNHKDVGIDRLYLNENIGYARSCNNMAFDTSSRYLMILNADVWMNNEAIESLVRFMDSNPSTAVVGPKQRDEASRITHAGIVGTNSAPKHRGWKTFDPRDVKFKDTIDCVTVSGSAYFVRRSVWDEMTNCPIYAKFSSRFIGEEAKGGFLMTPHYWEETAFSYHVRHHGYKVKYHGEVSIGHTWHASSEVGGSTEKWIPLSRSLFRNFCQVHGIEHD